MAASQHSLTVCLHLDHLANAGLRLRAPCAAVTVSLTHSTALEKGLTISCTAELIPVTAELLLLVPVNSCLASAATVGMEPAQFRALHRDSSHQWADRKLQRDINKALPLCVNECMCESVRVSRLPRRFWAFFKATCRTTLETCPGPDPLPWGEGEACHGALLQSQSF